MGECVWACEGSGLGGGISLIFSFAQVCLALNHLEWLWPQPWHVLRILCTSERECVFAQNWLRMKGAKGVIERAIFPPHSLQHVSASAWKQLSQSICFCHFIFCVCAKHISQSLVLQLSALLQGHVFVKNPSSYLNCLESWIKKHVSLKIIFKFNFLKSQTFDTALFKVLVF